MMARLIRRLGRDERGATLIEFALLAPTMFALILGVLQIGLGMQAYNSLRGIASDTARYAVTSYQIRTDPSENALRNRGRSIATQAPYGLQADELSLIVNEEATPRVAGAKEFSITIRYNVPSLLTVIGIDSIPITYERPIFVIDNT